MNLNKLQKKYHHLIPVSGKADTVHGEMLKAAFEFNKWYKDGDYYPFWTTPEYRVNPLVGPVLYLVYSKSILPSYRRQFKRLFKTKPHPDEYDNFLKILIRLVVAYVENVPNETNSESLYSYVRHKNEGFFYKDSDSYDDNPRGYSQLGPDYDY